MFSFLKINDLFGKRLPGEMLSLYSLGATSFNNFMLLIFSFPGENFAFGRQCPLCPWLQLWSLELH